jgi:hypothetical protein
MTDSITDSFILRLEARGLKGNRSDELTIRDLEQCLRVDFPPAYKAFLIVAGNGCEALEGSHYAIEDDLASLQRSGRKIMKQGGAAEITDAFVFVVHQGYVCNFFFLHDGDDPPVYESVQGVARVRKVAASFSEWLCNQLDSLRAHREGRAGKG